MPQAAQQTRQGLARIARAAWQHRRAAATVALTATLGALAGQTVWHAAAILVPAEAGADVARGSPSRAGKSEVAPADDGGRALANLHLFGEPTAETNAPETPVAQSDAPLELRGVVAGPAAETSLALIAEAGQSPSVYREGETVPGGLTVAEIQADRVLLRADDELEALTFAREELGEDAAGESAAAGPSAEPTTAARLELPTDPAALQAALGELELVPAAGVGDGGLRLAAMPAEHPLRAVGLAPGDVVVRIGDVAIGPQTGPARLVQSLTQRDRVTVVYYRGGERRERAVRLVRPD